MKISENRFWQYPAYLTEWYYTKVKYPLKGKMSYFTDTDESYVYVIYNNKNGLYKIGITGQIKQRLNTIRTQSGCDVDIVLLLQLHTGYDEDARTIEALLHKFFKSRRMIGEWFNFNVKCLIAIRNLFFEIEGEDICDNLKQHVNKKI